MRKESGYGSGQKESRKEASCEILLAVRDAILEYPLILADLLLWGVFTLLRKVDDTRTLEVVGGQIGAAKAAVREMSLGNSNMRNFLLVAYGWLDADLAVRMSRGEDE